ncbi:MAG: hypothetical protein K5644_04290 [Lachnospiraceae bacterium]|nr:hypothetical protein [Lachnospiraceae bacterium]
MSNLWLVMKVRADERFAISKIRHERNAAKKGLYYFAKIIKLSIAIAMAYLIYLFSETLSEAGYATVLPVISYIIASVISLIMTIIKINEKVSGRSDTEFLLSLPVPNMVQIVMLFIELYLEAIVYVILVEVPMGLVYAGAVYTDGFFWVRWLVGVLLTSLPVSGLAALLGIFLALVLSSFKNRNLIQSVMSLAAISAVSALMLYIIYRVASAIHLGLGLSPSVISDNIIQIVCSNYRFCRIYQNSVVVGEPLYILLLVLTSVVCYAFCIFGLSVAYQDFMLALKAPAVYKKFEMGSQAMNSLKKTIMKREISMWLRSKSYMTNSMIGFVIGIVGALGIFFIGLDRLSATFTTNGFSMKIGYILMLVICVLVGMCSTTFCSLSIEGNRVWIWQTSPVDDKLLYGAKILLNLMITIPLSLICAALFAFTFPMDTAARVCMFIVPLLYSVLCACWGMAADKRWADYSMESEEQIMTQSLSFVTSKLPQIVLPIIALAILVNMGNVL